MYDTDQYCKDCNKHTQAVEDHRQGDTICSECGLILEAHLIDTSAEWRVFNDSENDVDPQRTGDPVNPLLHDGASALLTTISIPPNTTLNKSDNNSSRIFSRINQTVHKTLNPNENSLTSAFATIANKASMLGLIATIVGRAQQIYKEADEKRLGRSRHEALTSACLLLASQEEGFPRTLKEIAAVGNGATMKDIGKMSKRLKKEMGISGKVTKAEDLTARSCSSIGMSRAAMKAVNETLEKLKEVDVRRTPKSVLAAVMYMVVQLSNDNVTSLKEVSQAADVAVGTTNKAYRDIYQYASSIIPRWFANQEDINKKLRIP